MTFIETYTTEVRAFNRFTVVFLATLHVTAHFE
jgi:hypothetical protein